MPSEEHSVQDTKGYGPVITGIKTRRSVRSYVDVPVEWDKLVTAVEAGMMAPSAGNLQIWRFAIVRGAEKRKAIAEACLQQYWMEQAPAHIAIFAKLTREEQYYGVRGTRLYSIQDCAMAAMNIMLAAQELGLSTCFVSAFDEEAMGRIFKLPGDVRPQGVITIGYSDEKPDVPLRYRVEQIVGVESYGTAMNEGRGRIPDPAAAVSTFRYAERGTKFVQEAMSDISKISKRKRQKLVEKLMGKLKKPEKKDEKESKNN